MRWKLIGLKISREGSRASSCLIKLQTARWQPVKHVLKFLGTDASIWLIIWELISNLEIFCLKPLLFEISYIKIWKHWFLVKSLLSGNTEVNCNLFGGFFNLFSVALCVIGNCNCFNHERFRVVSRNKIRIISLKIAQESKVFW